MKRNESLISGPIGSALLAFVVPLMLSSLVQQLYVTADAVIVGRIAGNTALAAIDSVHTLFRFPINFMNGLAAGATILRGVAGFGAHGLNFVAQARQAGAAAILFQPPAPDDLPAPRVRLELRRIPPHPALRRFQ